MKAHLVFSALLLYSWVKRGWDTERVARPNTERLNVIAAQWNNEAYFIIKSETTKEEQFNNFAKQLDIELRNIIAKSTYQNRLIVMFDNASINKTKAVKI